jgi:hypothetical protein
MYSDHTASVAIQPVVSVKDRLDGVRMIRDECVRHAGTDVYTYFFLLLLRGTSFSFLNRSDTIDYYLFTTCRTRGA